jgi:hypothetical protein
MQLLDGGSAIAAAELGLDHEVFWNAHGMFICQVLINYGPTIMGPPSIGLLSHVYCTPCI